MGGNFLCRMELEADDREMREKDMIIISEVLGSVGWLFV